MDNFLGLADVNDLEQLVKDALQVKASPYHDKVLGSNKSICMVFLNPSLRTRLSTQRAALNLGMDAVVLDMNRDSWQLEMEDGTVMDGSKGEHVKEAAAVISRYYDVIALRSFAALEDREADYREKFLNQFVKYASVPVINMESPTRHPLQSLTDLMTIEEYKKTEKPKIVLTWVPHPKALPQAVANSFLEWMHAWGADITLTHPEGYALAEAFTKDIPVTHHQQKAFEGADFIYAKNWSSYQDYGKILSKDTGWMVTAGKMKQTNNARFMHCLPARRNVIAEDAVFDGKDSIIIDQAANRVPAAQAVLKNILR